MKQRSAAHPSATSDADVPVNKLCQKLGPGPNWQFGSSG